MSLLVVSPNLETLKLLDLLFMECAITGVHLVTSVEEGIPLLNEIDKVVLLDSHYPVTNLTQLHGHHANLPVTIVSTRTHCAEIMVFLSQLWICWGAKDVIFTSPNNFDDLINHLRSEQ